MTEGSYSYMAFILYCTRCFYMASSIRTVFCVVKCSNLGRLIDLALPVCDVVVDDLRCLVNGKVSANGLDKIAFGVCSLESVVA